MLEWVILVLLISILILFFRWSGGWESHLRQTKTYTTQYGWGSFDKFKEEFDKCNWEWKPTWKYSLFDYDSDSEIHAGIIKFNGDGMLLNPIDYVRARLYVKKYISDNFEVGYSRDNDLWK